MPVPWPCLPFPEKYRGHQPNSLPNQTSFSSLFSQERLPPSHRPVTSHVSGPLICLQTFTSSPLPLDHPSPPHPPLPHPWGSRQYQNTLLGQPSWNKYTLSRPHTPILTQETSSLQFCSHHPLISNFCTHHSTETALSETTVQPPPPPRLESWQLQGSALRPASRCWQLPAHFQHLPHLSYRPKNFNYKHLYLCLKVCSGHRSMLSSHGQAGSARELVSPGSSSQPTADRIW